MAAKTDAKELIKALTEVTERLDLVGVYIGNARDFCRPRSGASVLDTMIVCDNQASKGGRALAALQAAIKKAEKLMSGVDKTSPMYKLAKAMVDRAKRAYREDEGEIKAHQKQTSEWYKRLSKIKHA